MTMCGGLGWPVLGYSEQSPGSCPDTESSEPRIKGLLDFQDRAQLLVST